MRYPKIQIYAVLRFDKYLIRAAENIESCIAVQAVLPTIDEARSEAWRLNEINDTAKVVYFVLATRYYPEGRSTSSDGG